MPGFYLYQSTKVVAPPLSKTISITPPQVSPEAGENSSIFLAVDNPKDEEVSETKTITISGITTPDATVVILTTSTHEIVKPSSQGNFTTNITIDDGANYIKIWAIAPNGEIETVERIVSYTTEDF